MRVFAVCGALLALLWPVGEARAQACGVLNGVDYRFERRVATRDVDDPFDRGRIALAVYVYRPLRQDRNSVVLFSHGSLNGLVTDPGEPANVNCALKDFFLSRGYTLVVPMRRGRGESGGHYVEECGRGFDPACTPARNREMTALGLDQAVADTLAVLDQVVLAGDAARRPRVVLTGLSRGGFLSLAVAAARPQEIAAVVSFSGGWLGLQSDIADADEARLRLELHERLLRGFGGRFAGPTLWLHAPDDPFYGEAASRRFHAAFLAGGGRGDYVSVPAVAPWKHNLLGQPELWRDRVETFLDASLR
ncbi:MAG: alpha/beta hydrolase family protein [Allosphingosinicella sp.]